MYYTLLGPLLRLLPPEVAHDTAIAALKYQLLPPAPTLRDSRLSSTVFGLSFPNPVGLAAGFDKNAECLHGLLAQGFGFVETGTVTPKPQRGNAAPRLFRLPDEHAIINRLGFNNLGLERFVKQLQDRPKSGIIGANIGKNKQSDDAIADYVTGLSATLPYADYITVNISSPNTEGLRDLQGAEALTELIDALLDARAQGEKTHNVKRPLLIKIAPDLEDEELEAIAKIALAKYIDGLIISNTTVARPTQLSSRHRHERGGLSGTPLFASSTAILSAMYGLTEGKIPLIGVGGIASAEDAYAKIRAGASLVQLYTALVYQGFACVQAINEGLLSLLERDGFSHISEAIGADHNVN